jgi:serine/threonine protein kinase
MIGFKINHPNIIKIKGIGRGLYDNLQGAQAEVAYILMEALKEGEILNVLMNSGKFSESTARYFFKQILSALSYMHNTVGVCHRDLKLDNILLDENFNLRLADLGFAISSLGHTGDGKLHSYKGTLCYMTPEQLDQRSYCGKQADLFAAAVILFMMVFEKRPFDEARVSDPFYKLIAGNRTQMYWRQFEKCCQVSEELKDLLQGMMQLNPSSRNTLEEILAHPWVQGETPSDEEIRAEFSLRKTYSHKANSTSSSSN